MRTGNDRENGLAHLQGWSAVVTIGWGWGQDLEPASTGGKRSPFADLGPPDQLHGNPLIPVIENTTLGRFARHFHGRVDALAAISRKRDRR